VAPASGRRSPSAKRRHRRGHAGRLPDLAEQKVCRSHTQVSLDEADRMLDMGFIPAIRRVLKLLPAVRQNLMFSATYSEDIRELAGRFLRNPESIEVSPRNTTVEKVEQTAYRVPKDLKRHLLAHLIKDGQWHQVLVFTRTKHGANRLAEQLDRAGIPTAAIHGNKPARIGLEDFKANRIVALVATEVAARGLDIKELPYVVNYELPNVPEDYVHRIGRTARAGSTGMAISLVSPDESSFLKDIVRLLGQDVPTQPLPQFEILDTGPSSPRHVDPRRQHAPRQNAPRQSAPRSGGNASRGRPAHGQRSAPQGKRSPPPWAQRGRSH
jgi:ATP-dependent RNA helicase RhlE